MPLPWPWDACPCALSAARSPDGERRRKRERAPILHIPKTEGKTKNISNMLPSLQKDTSLSHPSREEKIKQDKQRSTSLKSKKSKFIHSQVSSIIDGYVCDMVHHFLASFFLLVGESLRHTSQQIDTSCALYYQEDKGNKRRRREEAVAQVSISMMMKVDG